MKILFCTYNQPDYGLDTFYDGLCQLLGPENILEYPCKPSLHGANSKRFSNYPIFSEYPMTKTDDEKLAMLGNGEIDMIFVGCKSDSGFWNSRYDRSAFDANPLARPILHASKTIPTFLVDQGDAGTINSNLMEKFNAVLYFKREYHKDQDYPKEVVPLVFSYSEKKIPVNINTERTNTLFWAGQEYPKRNYRTPYLFPLKKALLGGKRFPGFTQEEYSRRLLSNKIGLNLRGYGYDTVRYWELPAHGTLLFSEKINIVIENDFTDGETAVFFSSPDEMLDKLKFCMENESYVDKIRMSGYDLFKKYHTSKKRAEQVLEKIKATLAVGENRKL